MQHVRLVLRRLLENSLFLKAGKCEFHADTVSFLGSIIQQVHLSPDPTKIRAVTEWPPPQARKQLQQFLGLANFYRWFIRNFSKVVALLTELTSTLHLFAWTERAEVAFAQLKVLFTSAPILSHPDPSRQFVVEVDAFYTGVRAVLSQRSVGDENLHPCAFFSRHLTPLSGITMWGTVSCWRWCWHCTPFIVWTDHKNRIPLWGPKG